MSNLIQGKTGEWEIVIGLEVHAQVIAKSKLFSGSATTFGSDANTQVSLVDAAMPGMLPVINEYCIEQAVRTGLGLGAKINLTSVFERKNYFYADLPQGYQISQQEIPIVGEGEIEIELPDGTSRNIGIERLHMEQDAGKSIHDKHPTRSYIDLNRSGNCLMEIVSKPDMRSADEAMAYVAKLRAIVRALETCDGNMDEGSMRCDVNVSVRKIGDELGTRREVKNVNSIRSVGQAVDYEARDQIRMIEAGEKVTQQTMLFNADDSTTRPMRSKEDAHDYRYFPDPDLLPLVISQQYVDAINENLPELPDAKKHRFMQEYGMKLYDASIIAGDKPRAEYFERVAKGRDPKLSVTWVTTELMGALNKLALSIDKSPVSSEQLGELIDLISDNTISGRIAKDVFAEMLDTGKSASNIVEEKGLKQVTDTGALETLVDEVIAENPDVVANYQSGKDKLFGFFVGQVMKKTQGKANPAIVNELLKKKIG